MRKAIVTLMACATLLGAATALAGPTPQQNCDYARTIARKKYVSCIRTAVAKDAKGVRFDEELAFAKCRHMYFKDWTDFQPNALLAGSTCIGARFTDNGDGTVTDNLTRLVWEQKIAGDTGLHSPGNVYSWSAGAPAVENGTAFSDFLASVNGGSGLAGATGWRLPTLAEMQTILPDFTLGSSCSNPCVDPALSPAQPFSYWSATSSAGPSPPCRSPPRSSAGRRSCSRGCGSSAAGAIRSR
jgi:hypothetical protein